jgi:hypothetical protein
MLLADAWLTTEDWLGPLLALLPVLYLSAFVHELGHALLGRLAGLRVTSFGIGLGRPFLVFGCRGMRVYLARKGLLQGVTFLHPDTVSLPSGRLLAFMAGGIIAQLVLALLALGAWWLLPWGRGIWLMTAGLNLLWGLANLLPFQFNAGGLPLRSDGALMLHVLRWGECPSLPPQEVQMLLALSDLWLTIDDKVGLLAQTLTAADSWLQLGCPEQALRLCAEAEALAPAEGSFEHALGPLIRAEAERQTERPEQAMAALDEAERRFTARGDEGALFLIARVRAELAGGGATEATARLRALLDHPTLTRAPGLRYELWGAWLTARAELPGADLRALSSEYEGGSVPRSLVRDVRIYRALACEAVRRGNVDVAARAFRRALAAVDRINGSWATDPEREAYLRGQAPLLAEARAFFTSQGLSSQVEAMDGCLRPATDSEGAKQGRRKHAARMGHLLGAVMGLAQVIVGATLPTLVDLLVEPPDEGLRGFARHIVLFGALVICYESSMFLLRRTAPSWGLDGRGWAWVGPVLSALTFPTWILFVLAGAAPPPDERSHGRNSVYHASEPRALDSSLPVDWKARPTAARAGSRSGRASPTGRRRGWPA